MNVYFGQNFWSKREDGKQGIPKQVDWKFTYDNEEYFIPMIYYFPEGITFHIINLINNEKYKMFYEKYAPIECELTEEESLFVEQENPIPELPIRSIYINDKIAEINLSSSSYIPFLNNNRKDVLNEIKEEYNICEKQAFQCIRVNAKCAIQKEIEQLKIVTSKTEKLLPVRKHFTVEIGTDEKQYDIAFQHPLTKIEHQLYVNNVTYHDAKVDFNQHDDNEHHYYVMIKYELVPSLPEDERILIQGIKQEDIKKCDSISSIGVIYYNENNEIGIHGEKLDYAFSQMYYKELDNINFSIVGIYKTKCLEAEFIF